MNSTNGSGPKISLPTILIPVLLALLAWMGAQQLALSERPDRQEVAQTAAKAVEPKAAKEDVVRLDEQIKAVSKSLEKIDAKLDKIIEQRIERKRER